MYANLRHFRNANELLNFLTGHITPFGDVVRDVPVNHFCTASEWLTTLSPTVFSQRNLVANFLQVKCNFRRKQLFGVFKPSLRDFGVMHGVHLKLTGKRVA